MPAVEASMVSSAMKTSEASVMSAGVESSAVKTASCQIYPLLYFKFS
jgi:hypothetical protein